MGLLPEHAAGVFRKRARSVGFSMRNCGSWFLAIGDIRQALQASFFR